MYLKETKERKATAHDSWTERDFDVNSKSAHSETVWLLLLLWFPSFLLKHFASPLLVLFHPPPTFFIFKRKERERDFGKRTRNHGSFSRGPTDWALMTSSFRSACNHNRLLFFFFILFLSLYTLHTTHKYIYILFYWFFLFLYSSNDYYLPFPLDSFFFSLSDLLPFVCVPFLYFPSLISYSNIPWKT